MQNRFCFAAEAADEIHRTGWNRRFRIFASSISDEEQGMTDRSRLVKRRCVLPGIILIIITTTVFAAEPDFLPHCLLRSAT